MSHHVAASAGAKFGLKRCAALAAAFGAVVATAPVRAADCKSAPSPSVDWSDCGKSMLLLSSSDLTGANLAGADLSSTDLAGSTLTGANLEKATLSRASLAGAVADKANFARAEAYRTSFAGVSAQGASFAGAELQRTDFSGANVTGADFEKAELGRINFDKTVITGVRFSMANLSRAEMRTVSFEGPLDFNGAFLFLARIEGLDLSQATGLKQWQIDLACGDANTRLPEGLTAPPGWPCKFEND